MAHPVSRCVVSAILIVAPLMGCVQPSPEDIIKGASGLLLMPEESCAQLRVDFNLLFLPVVTTPAEVNLKYEEHWVDTPDGQLLRVWYFPGKGDQGVIILSNGLVGEIACYLFLTMLLEHNGWSVVMYDYRGFGGSTGDASLLALIPDLSTIVDWTLQYTGQPQVTLFGQSLGSIPSVAMAVERPDVVNAVVLDSPAAPRGMLDAVDTGHIGVADYFAALVPPDFMSDDVIAQMKQPVLFYLDEADTLTPPATIRELYNRAGGPKTLVRFGGLDHYRGIFYQTDAYAYAFQSFLLKVWTGAGLPDLVPQLLNDYRNGVIPPTIYGEPATDVPATP